MMEWRTQFDEELAELLTQEAERQKPPEPIQKTYWLEAGILFGICVGILCWWMR